MFTRNERCRVDCQPWYKSCANSPEQPGAAERKQDVLLFKIVFRSATGRSLADTVRSEAVILGNMEPSRLKAAARFRPIGGR